MGNRFISCSGVTAPVLLYPSNRCETIWGSFTSRSGSPLCLYSHHVVLVGAMLCKSSPRSPAREPLALLRGSVNGTGTFAFTASPQGSLLSTAALDSL